MSTLSNETFDTIAKRSSTRGYSAEKLTEEELDTILTAGLMAPSGMNRQEVHYTVAECDNPVLKELDEELARLRGEEKQHNFYYEAPVVIMLSAEDDFKWSTMDAGIAVQNMALAAESIGLGSVILGCIYDVMHGEKQKYYEENFKFPAGYSFRVAIAVGHKAANKAPHEYDYAKQVTRV